VHLEPEKHTAYEDPLQDLRGMQVTFDIQRACKVNPGKGKTKVLAASLVTAEECFALCGIEHITLSSAALALLQKTPLDERFKGIRDRSLAYLKSEEGPQRNGSSGFWTADLNAALADPEVDSLQTDALKQFTIAENALRVMAKEALRQP
jgi:transaldolase